MKDKKSIIIIAICALVIIGGGCWFLLKPKSVKAEYTIKEWGNFAQNVDISISDNSILKAVKSTEQDSKEGMLTGGENTIFTIKGLKEGTTTATVKVINPDGSTESTKVYYFEVDANLNVKFIKVEEDKKEETSSIYEIEEFKNNSQSIDIDVSNNEIIEAVRSSESVRDIKKSGTTTTFNVKGLKPGTASATVTITDADTSIATVKTYYFEVTEDLTVNYVRMEELSRNTDSSKAYVIKEWGNFAQEITIELSDSKVIKSVKSTEENNSGALTGGTTTVFTISGLKKGIATAAVKVTNPDGSTESDKTYYFEVNNSLDVKLVKVEEASKVINAPKPYEIKEFVNFAQSIKIDIDYTDIIKSTESTEENNTGALTGGTTTVFTITGLKKGTAQAFVTIKNSNGSIESSKVYLFKVNDNLDVKLVRVDDNIPDNSNSPETSTAKTYDIEQWGNFAQDITIELSNSKIIKSTESTKENNPGELTGGATTVFTISGLKKGTATAIVKVMEPDKTVGSTKKYYFEVNDNLDVNYIKVEEINS